MYITPWSERVAVLADTMSMNDDAQRRAAELTDELKAVLKDLRSKVRPKLSDFRSFSVYAMQEQAVQESSVKIQLMEKRVEAVKRQAESLAELEAELSTHRKQEQAYTDTIDSLNKEIETLEQERTEAKQQQALAAPDSTQNSTSGASRGTLLISVALQDYKARRWTMAPRRLQALSRHLICYLTSTASEAVCDSCRGRIRI